MGTLARVASGEPASAIPSAPEGADRAMAAYARGDDDAFGEVYEALAPPLLGHLRRECRDAASAEDLLQQTFLHMIRGRGTFRPGAAVRPWAFAIARCLLIDSLRRWAHRAIVPSGDPPDVAAVGEPDQIVGAQRAARRVDAALHRLPAAQRSAFALVRQDGLSQREAAEVLGTSEKAVKALVHRASDALRAVVGDEFEVRRP